jgi:hypothetical protein
MGSFANDDDCDDDVDDDDDECISLNIVTVSSREIL